MVNGTLTGSTLPPTPTNLAVFRQRYAVPPEKFSQDDIRGIIHAWLRERTPVTVTERKYAKPRQTINDLSADERASLDSKLSIVLDLIARRILYDRILPKGKRKLAAEALGVKERNVNEMIYKLEEHIPEYLDKPERWGECLIDNKGRPKGTYEARTDEDRLAIRLGVTVRERTGVDPDGTRFTSSLLPGIDVIEDVNEFAKGLREGELPSIHTVRREVKDLISENPAYYKLLTEGSKALRRDAAFKVDTTPDEIDEVHLWDATDLPMFINDNGVVCTATLLEVIEAKEDYRIHWWIYPKKERDEQGNVLPSTFNKEDAMVFTASGLWKNQRRPLRFWNDGDKRLMAVEEVLPRLTVPGEIPIQMVDPEPGTPWPRGLKEVGFARRLIRFLRRYNGRGYYNKRDRSTIRDAIKDPSVLFTPEQLALRLNEFYENLNKEPRVQEGSEKAKRPSRADAYHSIISPRPCPPIRRLYHLMPADRRVENWIQFDHLGFDFAKGGEKHWVPTVKSRTKLPDLILRLMNAALSDKRYHMFAIHLNFGWVVEVCLEDEWFEAVPRSKFPFSNGDVKWAINETIRQLQATIDTDRARDVAEAIQKFGNLPERDNTSVHGVYRLQGSTDTSSDAQPNNAQSKQPSTSSPLQQPRGTPPATPGADEVDWSDLF